MNQPAVGRKGENIGVVGQAQNLPTPGDFNGPAYGPIAGRLVMEMEGRA